MSLSIEELEGSVKRTELPGFYDARSKCRVVVTTPRRSPDLWQQNLDGAVESYTAFGVLEALEYEKVRSGASTALFFAVIDSDERLVGGVRVQGPYRSAEQSHAVKEWTDPASRNAVRQIINSRVPGGVAEMKSGWVRPGERRGGEIADVIGRCAVHTLAILDIEHSFATGAAHILARWRRSGGVSVDEIPPAPYPSDRYETKLVWWQKSRFSEDGDSVQVVKVLSEWMEIAESMHLPGAGLESAGSMS